MARSDNHSGWQSYRLLALLLLVLIAVITWRFLPRTPWDGLDPDAVPRAVTPRGDLAEDEKTTIAV